jgi:hypothetical protein
MPPMAMFRGENFNAYPVTGLTWVWHISPMVVSSCLCIAGRGLACGGAGGDGRGGCGLGGGGVSSRLRFRLNLFLGTEEAMGGVVRLNRKEIKTSNRSMPL